MADGLNIQVLPKGFGSYLEGIIPQDQAIAAGAFSMAMQQIKNISQANGQQFSQVVQNLETNNQLPATAGTDVPVDTNTVNQGLSKIALGGGVNGTYTHSDFFGAMTGLPYPLSSVQTAIKEVQTPVLQTAYTNIYNLTNWGLAEATVKFDYYTGNSNYIVTAFVVTNAGGGYSAPPSVTVNGGSGAVGTAVIGTDPDNFETYGKVISITLDNPGIPSVTIPTVTLSAPPNDGLGTNWNDRNNDISANIAIAQAELTSILGANSPATANLITNWNLLGTALMTEQRARYIGVPPVTIPRDKFAAQYPTELSSFVDSVASYAADTLPHGAAQSLEAIADRCSVSGQSLIGLMREQRNEQRLSLVGIPLVNDVPATLSTATQQQLFNSKGSVPNAVAGIPPNDVPLVVGVDCCNVQTTTAQSNVTPYTIPSTLQTNLCSGETITTQGMPASITSITKPIANIAITVLQPTPTILPPTLITTNTANTLSPATSNVAQAVNSVNECNHDSWVI